MNKNEAKWTKYAIQHLKGRTIKNVAYLSEESAKEWGWYHRPLVIQLDDDTVIYPACDDEHNDGGAIHGIQGGGEIVFPTL